MSGPHIPRRGPALIHVGRRHWYEYRALRTCVIVALFGLGLFFYDLVVYVLERAT